MTVTLLFRLTFRPAFLPLLFNLFMKTYCLPRSLQTPRHKPFNITSSFVMNRSLIAFQALIASSAVLCQTAEASATYSSPDQLNNSIEARIDSVRNGDSSSLLKTIDNDGELVAKSKWGNGGGHKFSNSYGSGKWKNGKGGNK